MEYTDFPNVFFEMFINCTYKSTAAKLISKDITLHSQTVFSLCFIKYQPNEMS
jgi:hypothetical protein